MQTPFAIDVTGSAARPQVALRGELDLAHAQSLEEAIGRLCGDGAREILLDMGGVVFIDSSGLRALLASLSRCQEQECEFALGSDLPMPVQRLFEVAGVGGRFRYAPSKDGAGE